MGEKRETGLASHANVLLFIYLFIYLYIYLFHALLDKIKTE